MAALTIAFAALAVIAALAACYFYRMARQQLHAANQAHATAAEALDLLKRYQAPPASIPAQTLTRQQIDAIEALQNALSGMTNAAHQYKALAETLQCQLDDTRSDRADWEAAVNYHLATIQQLSTTNEQLYGQIKTLQAMYAHRTQDALRAGLTRFVVTHDAGYIQK